MEWICQLVWICKWKKTVRRLEDFFHLFWIDFDFWFFDREKRKLS